MNLSKGVEKNVEFIIYYFNDHGVREITWICNPSNLGNYKSACYIGVSPVAFDRTCAWRVDLSCFSNFDHCGIDWFI